MAFDQPQDQSQDPSMQDADDGSSGGYTIEISVGGDGSLSVSVESAAQEGAEAGGESGAQAPQPAANIKEALTLALGAYKNNGQLPDLKGQNDSFQEGFSGVAGGGAQ